MTVTTLRVWRVRPAAVPRAFWGAAVNRGRLRRTPGVRFAKVLGTSRRFSATAADLTRWAALVVSDGAPPPIDTGPVTADCTLTLRPVTARGSWSGRQPFECSSSTQKSQILVLTRARLRVARAPAFWRAIDPVGQTLRDQEGLIAAFGFGEAPLGFQGTVSIWRGAADLVRFAYRQPEHAAVVASTHRQRWYAEELFARFHVLDIAGDREVIGWTDGP